MLTKDRVVSVKERSPEVEARVIVVCETFRCLGYVDQNGIWRYDNDSKPIESTVTGWFPFGD